LERRMRHPFGVRVGIRDVCVGSAEIEHRIMLLRSLTI
jgi:hypothetical protein